MYKLNLPRMKKNLRHGLIVKVSLELASFQLHFPSIEIGDVCHHAQPVRQTSLAV